MQDISCVGDHVDHAVILREIVSQLPPVDKQPWWS